MQTKHIIWTQHYCIYIYTNLFEKQFQVSCDLLHLLQSSPFATPAGSADQINFNLNI